MGGSRDLLLDRHQQRGGQDALHDLRPHALVEARQAWPMHTCSVRRRGGKPSEFRLMLRPLRCHAAYSRPPCQRPPGWHTAFVFHYYMLTEMIANIHTDSPVIET